MVGFVEEQPGRGRTRFAVEQRWGLTLVVARVHRLGEKRLLKLERELGKRGVDRVVNFPGRPVLLKKIDPAPLYRWAADLLILRWMEFRDLEPRHCCVALAGPRLSPELRQTAQGLTSRVREIRVDVPGGEGFAQTLHREWGIPLVPPGKPAQVRASFGPVEGEADLRLWGESPSLGGLELRSKQAGLPPPWGSVLLTLLWEQGRVKKEELEVSFAGQNSSETLVNAEKP